MTAARRSLVLLAGLALGPLPACLHVTATVPDPAPVPAPPPNPPAKEKFATLPARPGEVVRTTPAEKTAAKPPADPADGLPLPPGPPPDLAIVKAEPGPLPGLGAPPADPPLVQALRAFLDNRADDGLRHLRGLDPANQDFALALLPVLVRGSQWDLAAADPAEVGVVADQLHAAAARLETRAALKVERVAFCQPVARPKVGRYAGKYDPRPEVDPYRVGDKAYLYVEVKHVSGHPAADGDGYVCRVNVGLEVRDSHGNVVEQVDPHDPALQRRVPVARFLHEDPTRGPVRDWYHAYSFGVPHKPGVYTITVEARDPAGTRVAKSRPVSFHVAER